MSTELVIVENLELVPFFTKGDQVKSILDRLTEEADSFVAGDLSVAKNRKAVTEMVTKFTKSKTYLESKGKELAAEYKAIPKAIDANRKIVKDTITGLQEVVRKPLTDWEYEQAVIESARLAAKEAEALAIAIADCEEIASLIDEKFDRQKADDIAKAESDKLAYEAELKSKAVEQAKADALVETQRVAAETAEKERLAIQREADLKAQAKQAEEREKQWAIDAENARKQKIIDDENVKKQRVLDAEKADILRREGIELARQKEVARQNAEQAQLLEEQRQKDANKEHCRAVNNLILDSLMDHGMSKEKGIEFIGKVLNAQVSNIAITY